LRGSEHGVQRTSRHSHARPLTGLLLTATLLGSLAAAPSVGATTASTVRIATTTALTTTIIDRPWLPTELYVLGLINCTRTGGWVTSSGSCSSPGGRNVAALKLDAGISTKVSRPYARKLVLSGVCSHFSGGTPGDRLRAAGYTSYRWAENLGCRGGSPYGAVLGTHIYFQSEKSYGGGHYVNMMNAMYDRVGIGVWVASGGLRLVIGFYHPL